MTQLIKSDQRYHADHGWLDTHWHFSFSDYYDPKNMNFGALRVFNDDVIQGGGGFGMHPHADMEIITVVLTGELEHKDSLGNGGVIRPGDVQVMSAGRGIKHAEFNHSKTQPLHLMQIWILPRHEGNTPRWEQKPFDPAGKAGKLMPVVSSGNIAGTLAIDQDAAIYLSHLSPGQKIRHDLAKTRLAYLFVISGSVAAGGKTLEAGDQLRVSEESSLAIQASSEAELILLDLPQIES